MAKPKFRTSVTAELRDGQAFIRIVDYIGEWEDTGSSRSIRREIDGFLAQGVVDCSVYLNSRGGSTVEATEIKNELKRFTSVEITVGAIAASAATYLMAHFRTVIKKGAQIMVHMPILYASGNLKQIQSEIKLLQNITDDYRQSYAAKTGMTEDQIEELWAQGDLWMTAEEAVAQGFADQIEGEELQFSEDDIDLIQACGAPVVPAIHVSKPQNTHMDKLKLIALLGLAADATDDQIQAAVQDAKDKADQHAASAANIEAAAKTRAKTLVAAALKDRKITAPQVASFEALAEKDYDSVAACFAGMPAKETLSNQITRTGTGEVEARKGWTLDDYLSKAPDVYARMKDEDPDAAKALENEYFSGK